MQAHRLHACSVLPGFRSRMRSKPLASCARAENTRRASAMPSAQLAPGRLFSAAAIARLSNAAQDTSQQPWLPAKRALLPLHLCLAQHACSVRPIPTRTRTHQRPVCFVRTPSSPASTGSLPLLLVAGRTWTALVISARSVVRPDFVSVNSCRQFAPPTGTSHRPMRCVEAAWVAHQTGAGPALVRHALFGEGCSNAVCCSVPVNEARRRGGPGAGDLAFHACLSFFGPISSRACQWYAAFVISSITTCAVLLYFLQIAVLIAGSGSTWLQFLHIFNFNAPGILGTACIGPISPYGKLALTIFSPAIFLAELALTAALQFALTMLCNPKQHWLRFKAKAYRRSLFALFLFSYSQTATTCFEYLVCCLCITIVTLICRIVSLWDRTGSCNRNQRSTAIRRRTRRGRSFSFSLSSSKLLALRWPCCSFCSHDGN